MQRLQDVNEAGSDYMKWLSAIVHFLIVPFSGFYLTGLLPVSPVYVFFLFALMLFPAYLALGRWRVGGDAYFSPYFFSLILAFACYASFIDRGQLSPSYIGLMLGLAGSAILYLIFAGANLPSFAFSYSFYKWFSLILLSAEACFRLSNPAYDRVQDLALAEMKGQLFYVYKFASFMYMDSNFVAMQILVLIFFMKESALIEGRPEKGKILWAFVLLLATLSRAAIISGVFFYLLFYMKSKLLRSLIFLGTLTGAVFVLANISDDSLETKMYIFSATANYLTSADMIELLVGVGFGNSDLVIGTFAAHSIFLIILIEAGLFGLILFCVYLICQFAIGGAPVVRMAVPYLIAGLSFASLSAPFFMVSMMALGAMSRKVKND